MLRLAVTSICLSQDDKLRKLCAIGNDNRAWVRSAFEVRAGGAGVSVNDNAGFEKGINPLIYNIFLNCNGFIKAGFKFRVF